ncbi:MAG: peptidoglycan-binding domain-containing protein [Chthoniobacterales bacterium]
MKKGLLCVGLLVLLQTGLALADEGVRQVQEELRKRNFYFGDINGVPTPDLASSLKRYQARKGFPPTGEIDRVTAASLDVEMEAGAEAAPTRLPDLPVLRSDRAPEIPAAERLALAEAADKNPDALPTPLPPAEAPPETDKINPEKVTAFVQNYLRDSETADIRAQTEKYFAYPVKYFSDGMQGPAFVEKDVGYYLRRWPKRHYTLLAPVRFTASPHAGETHVQFDISFDLQKESHHAVGRTRNFWTIRPEGNDLKIVSIQEQRLRE